MAIVWIQPNDSVHHEMIRLVSLNFRFRNRIATVVSTSKHHRMSFWAKRRISDHFSGNTKDNSQRCFASLNSPQDESAVADMTAAFVNGVLRQSH